MQPRSSSQANWLKTYYYVRAAFSVAWVVSAIWAAKNPAFAAILLVIYPAWDALANLIDARASGGLRQNRSQAWNVAASSLMTVVVIVALMRSPYAVLGAFGIWAALSGLLQLFTALRRRRSEGAQWAMMLSGAQSVLAGAFMVTRSVGTAVPSILDVAPYAGFGAFYFLVSAVWLSITAYRRSNQLV